MKTSFLLVPFLAFAASARTHDVLSAPDSLAESVASRELPRAAVPADTERVASPVAFPGLDPTRVYFTQPEDVDNAAEQDQTIWARGDRYKASFDTRGGTYYPLFGAASERHHPIALSPRVVLLGGAPLDLSAPARAVRRGDRVELDRGAFVEAYDLRANDVEQSFTFARLDRDGELVLSIPLDTDLVASEGSEGLVFRHELGSVTYSRAVAIDARGARCAAPTHFVADTVEIRVPASFVASAELPLTIDPVVTTFPIDATANRFFGDADMAYDPDSHTWTAIYAEDVGPENDVLSVVFGDDPSTGGTPSFIDLSTDDWQHARIADNRAAQQFLVVGARTPPAAATVIEGRWIPAPGSAAPSLALTISGSESGTKRWPDVGGDSNPSGPTGYCVTYQLDKTSTDSDVVARLVDANGAQLSTTPLVVGTEAGKHSIEPAISASTNGSNEWSIAWLGKQDPAPPTRVWAARVATSGTISQARAIVGSVTGSIAVRGVAASSPVTGTRKSAVSWIEGPSLSTNSLYLNVRDPGDPSPNLNRPWSFDGNVESADTSVEYDGAGFQVVRPGHNGAVLATHVLVGLPRVPAAQTGLWYTSFDVSLVQGAQNPRIASAAAAGADVGFYRSTFVAFELRSPALGTPTSISIQGAMVTDANAHWTVFCRGDGVDGPCPCNNNGAFFHGCANSVDPAGALLGASGMNRLSNDSLVLHLSGIPASTTCTFFQEDVIQFTPGPFGDGLLCGASALLRLRTKAASAGVVDYPVGAEVPISVRGLIPSVGAQVGYQVLYRNAAAFCTPETLNVSNGIVSIWSP